ncbi:MAG: flagellar filament protein FlaA [Treponema sp.]|nr:flagellar filament protein FlaA [Treponema sp.]
MKKIFLAFLTVALVASAGVFAQASNSNGSTSITDPNAANIGNDSAREALREISVDRFEREGFWNVHCSSDFGVISGRLFDGGPDAKEPLNDINNTELQDTHVFGAKIEFFKRGVNSFYITAARPLPIEGITKTVSVWVCGRNMGHQLWLLVQDYYGSNFEIWMGSLEFSGWKKLTTAIPPSPDSEHGIIQQSAYHGDKPGLRIVGFRIDCSPMEARGSYYVYFDDLRAVTDLYDQENRDVDDMDDSW